MFTIRRAGHIVLNVTDVERAKRFLEDAVGFRTAGNLGSFFFLTANPISNHHMLAVRPHPGTQDVRLPDPRQIGMASAAYEVADARELQRLHARVERAGPATSARIVERGRRGTTETLVCADADGNRLEFFCSGGEDGATAAPDDRPARIGGISYLVLRVRDLARSRAFYTEELGLQVLADEGDGRVRLGGANAVRPVLVLEAGTDPAAPLPTPRAMFGLDHFALELASFADLCRAYRHFTARGLPIHHLVDHGVTLSLYFTDPDGNLMEIYHDVPRAEYANPFAPFDVRAPLEERLIAALRAPALIGG